MKKDKLSESLCTYINGQDKFAVMVDGPWGSGKTYFLKDVFMPDIRKIPDIKKTHDIKKNQWRQTTYFSVYGYESLHALKTNLFNELFATSLGMQGDEKSIKSGINTFYTFAKGAIGSFKKLKPFTALLETAGNIVMKENLRLQNSISASVLIIDDLERVSPTIHIYDLMGFLLTDIIEDYGYRVILVGNSKEIEKKEKSFPLIREKVISRVFPFTHNLINIKEDFLKNSKIDFLKDNSDWLIKIIEDYERLSARQFNIRTLEFILSTFKLIDNHLNQFLKLSDQERYRNDVEKSAFANLFVIATVYREGKLTRENSEDIDELYDTGNFLPIETFMVLKQYNKKQQDDANKSLAEGIISKYHHNKDLTSVIMYDRSVTNAILNGIFSDQDAQNFVYSWKKLFILPKLSSDLEEARNFSEMTDKQLKRLQHKMLQDACSQEAKAEDILSTLSDFMFFATNNICFYDNTYMKTLTKALKDAAIQSVESNESLYDYDSYEFQRKYSTLVKNKDVFNKVKNILNSVKDEKYRLEAQKLVKAIFEINNEKIRSIMQSGIKINIFEAILESDFLDTELLKPQSRASRLNKYILSSNYYGLHPSEEKDVSKLIARIKNYTKEDNTIGKIDRFNLNHLVETLYHILKKSS